MRQTVWRRLVGHDVWLAMSQTPLLSDEDDFVHQPVAETETTTGVHLALIIIGGTIGFAVFVIASQIGGALGYRGAAVAFGIGSLILGVMGAVTSYVGARSRLSTYVLTEFSFGRSGAKIANLAVALSLIGWFGVISNTLGDAARQMLLESLNLDVSPYLTVSVACVLMIGVTATGFTGIDRLALVMVPLMLGLIGFAALRALQTGEAHGFESGQSYTYQTAISAVVGSYISGVIIQPDYSRFAVNTGQAIWAVFIALGVVFPLVQFFSAIPSMAMGEPSIVVVMSALGIVVPAFFLLFLGAWSSNVLCLYSSSLSVATIFPRLHLTLVIFVIGAIGTALAFVPAQNYLIFYLELLGITIPPIGAVYIVDTLLVRRFELALDQLSKDPPVRVSAFVAWGLAGIGGYASSLYGLGLIGIPALDSIIIAAAVYAVLNLPHILRNGRAAGGSPPGSVGGH